jgi:hypothetical protein
MRGRWFFKPPLHLRVKMMRYKDPLDSWKGKGSQSLFTTTYLL